MDNIKAIITAKEEFPPDFYFHPNYFNRIAQFLVEQRGNDALSDVDFQYYIKYIAEHSGDLERDLFYRAIINQFNNLNFCFPTPQLIHNTTRIPIHVIKLIMQDQPTYFEFRKKPKQHNFRMIAANYPDEIWQVDLIDFTQTRVNGRYLYQDNVVTRTVQPYNDSPYEVEAPKKFILVVIDVFSRYLWCRALDSKTEVDIWNAFNDILRLNKRNPKIIVSDQEPGIKANVFQENLRRYNIKSWLVNKTGRHKIGAAIVERVNRTIKELIYKQFEYENLNQIRRFYRWVDFIDHLVESYNNNYHTTLKMSPVEARRHSNFNRISLQTSSSSDKYLKQLKQAPRFKVGDNVRWLLDKLNNENNIEELKTTVGKKQVPRFRVRGYTQTFSNKFTKINEVKYNGSYYYLLEKDLKYRTEVIREGPRSRSVQVPYYSDFYYEEELQKQII